MKQSTLPDPGARWTLPGTFDSFTMATTVRNGLNPILHTRLRACWHREDDRPWLAKHSNSTHNPVIGPPLGGLSANRKLSTNGLRGDYSP